MLRTEKLSTSDWITAFLLVDSMWSSCNLVTKASAVVRSMSQKLMSSREEVLTGRGGLESLWASLVKGGEQRLEGKLSS